MKIFEIPVELYCTKVEVLKNLSDDEFYEYFTEHFTETPERMKTTATCWIIAGKDDAQHYVLDFRKPLKKDSDSLNTIAHECLHAAFEILHKRCITLVHDVSDEAFCCLNAFIFEKVYTGLYS